MNVQCWLATETDLVRVSLRRFTFGESIPVERGGFPCPASPGRGHEARNVIHEQAPATDWVELRDGFKWILEERVSPLDERWPLTCTACGGEFPPEAIRQVWARALYRGAPDGQLYDIERLPVGAIYDAPWLHGWDGHFNPADGRSLYAVCPDGTHWNMDGPATNGGGWTRSGEPPLLTVRASIQTPNYHGYITDGWFVPC